MLEILERTVLDPPSPSAVPNAGKRGAQTPAPQQKIAREKTGLLRHLHQLLEVRAPVGSDGKPRWGLTPESFADCVPTAQRIAEGGEHTVFTIGHDPFGPVAKVNRRTSEAASDLLSYRQELLERYERLERWRQVLARFVGDEEAREAVVKEVAWDVPGMVRGTTAGTALLQSYVPEAGIPHYQLRAGYAELSPEGTLTGMNRAGQTQESNEESYQRMNEILVLNRGTDRFDVDEFLAVQRSDCLVELVRAAQENPALADHLRLLVRAMIAYSNETGQILDTLGEHNIILFERSDENIFTSRWIDPLFPNPNAVRSACAGLQVLRPGKLPAGRERVMLLNVLNYVRLVHGLGHILGISERFAFLPDDLANSEKPIDFRKFLRLLRN